jgi:hypothetical protein
MIKENRKKEYYNEGYCKHVPVGAYLNTLYIYNSINIDGFDVYINIPPKNPDL